MVNRRISALDSITTPTSEDSVPVVHENTTRRISLGQLQQFMAMACRLATTGNIDLNTGGLPVVDGIATVADNRILVWQQSDPAENGIYIAASGSWTRAGNFNTAQNMIRGVLIPILEGDTHSGSIFQHTTNQDITIDTTSIAFARATVSSGSGVAVNGNAVDLGGDLTQNTTIHNAGFDLDINGPGNLLLSGDGGTSITSAASVNIQGLTYPATDGTSGQVLTTDGVGNLVFQDAAVGGVTNLEDNSGNVQNSPLGTGHFQWDNIQIDGSRIDNPVGGNLIIDNSGGGQVRMETNPGVPIVLDPGGSGSVLLGGAGTEIASQNLTLGGNTTLGDSTIDISSSSNDANLVLIPKGTGTVQVPTGYENNITTDEDLINRRYFEDNLPVATGDVTTAGNPQPGQLALWIGPGAIEGNPGLVVEEDQLLTSGGITVNNSGELASGTLHLTQTNSGHAAIRFGENWALNTFEGPGGEVTDFAITNNTSGEHVLFIENGNRITISDASGGLGMQYAGDYSGNNAANERWIPDKAYVDNAIAGVGGGDVIRVGTPANNQLAIWTGNGSIEGDANFTWDGTRIGLNTAGLLKGSVSTNGDNNGFELAGNNNGADTTMHFKGIVQTGGDTGTNPIFSYTGNYNNTSELSARPILNAFNNNTMLFQVAANGNWDYQDNDLTNINIATISNVVIGGAGVGANSIHTLSGDLILEPDSGIVAVGNARISGSYFSANTTDAIYYGAGTSFSGGGGIHTYGNGNITNGGGLDIRSRSGGLLRFFHTNTIRTVMDGNGNWDYHGNALTNISNPVNPQDAATKDYVDNTVASVGGGDITKIGTPANSQMAIWTGDGTIEGSNTLTFDGQTMVLDGGDGLGILRVRGNTSAIMQVRPSAPSNSYISFGSATAITPTVSFGTSHQNMIVLNSESEGYRTYAQIIRSDSNIGTDPVSIKIWERAGTAPFTSRILEAGYNHETILYDINHDGTWNFHGNALTNISNPVNPQDAATKAYVDSTVAGVGGGGAEIEFGDFAPVVQSSEGGENVAYQHQYGIYYKIGQLVTVFIALTVADIAGGNGNFQIAELPFSTMENPEGRPDFVGTVSSNNPNFQGTAVAQTHGGNSMNIVNYEGQDVPWAALSNFDSFQVSLTYLTN